MRLRARLYDGDQKPRSVLVATRCKLAPKYVGPRYPYAESILAESRIQPYIHDCIITIQEHRRTHYFRVFYKRHTRLRTNNFLPTENNHDMRGSVFVMRVAALEPSSVVNMRGGDARLSDWMIGR